MTQATNTTVGEIVLAGDLAGGDGNIPSLRPSGVTPGKYLAEKIYVDAKGRVVYVAKHLQTSAPCSTSAFGYIKPGTGLDVTNGVLSVKSDAYPDATTSVSGICSIGSNITIAAGEISLPEAAVGTLGVIQTGVGLVSNAGVISVADADATNKGIVSAGSQGIAISAGVMSAVVGDATTKGIVQGSAQLPVTAGEMSTNIPDATSSVKGLITVSTGLDNTAGALSIVKGSGSATAGIVKSNNTSNITIASGLIDAGANISKIASANTFTKAQVVQLGTSAFSATYTPDFTNSNIVELTMTGNITTFNVPTGTADGGVYTIIVHQDAPGGRQIAGWNAAYKTNQSIVLSTAGNATDIITLIRKDSTTFYVLFTSGF